MNNFEKIKAMNIDEMIKFIKRQNMCTKCTELRMPYCRDAKCDEGIKQWLESEEE